ncbi:MAG: hypothetical protein HRU38_15200 [Saccharospirillaceae bacterium]|nr:hypothetical protein [Pseudomonadales bacterium]NRB79989.1 hypothetical protein [Saccharospirillaceae bacterium]
MNLKPLIISTLIIGLCSVSKTSKANYSELILGDWNCFIDVELVGMTMSITMQNSFSKDKSAKGRGLVKVQNAAIGMNLAYDVKVDQTWFIQNNTLYQTVVASSIQSLKSSFYESMFDTDSLLPVGQQESTKIMTLTQSSFLGLYNGLDLKCNR